MRYEAADLREIAERAAGRLERNEYPPRDNTRQGGRLAVDEPHGEDITQDDMDTIELTEVDYGDADVSHRRGSNHLET